MRQIEEWVGKTDDSAIPDRVKLRIFEREGRRCAMCSLPITAADSVEYHHQPPLADGGQHRETMIFPVHARCHKQRTAKEALARAEARATVKHHYGIKQSRNPMPGSKRSGLRKRMDGTVERR